LPYAPFAAAPSLARAVDELTRRDRTVVDDMRSLSQNYKREEVARVTSHNHGVKPLQPTAARTIRSVTISFIAVSTARAMPVRYLLTVLGEYVLPAEGAIWQETLLRSPRGGRSQDGSAASPAAG